MTPAQPRKVRGGNTDPERCEQLDQGVVAFHLPSLRHIERDSAFQIVQHDRPMSSTGESLKVDQRKPRDTRAWVFPAPAKTRADLQSQILNFAAAQGCTLALNTLQTIKNHDVRRVAGKGNLQSL
jgi:hypothetical protein